MRVQDMSVGQICRLLNSEDSELTECQSAELHEFVKTIGGIENARAAMCLLERLEGTG